MVFALAACNQEAQNTTNPPDDQQTQDVKTDPPSVNYPTKTIEIICPFGTGGDTDALCRAVADVMTKELGVSVMVTNMTGGSGSVASNYVKDADPDGYTVYFCHNTLVVNNICGISDFYHDAFTPAILVAQSSAFPYEIVRLAEDIAGGLMVTMPSEQDFQSDLTVGSNGETIGDICNKFFAAREGVSTQARQRILRLLENLCLGSAAVGYRTESMHGAGSPQAQRIMISRQGDLQSKKELAKRIAGIQ